MDIDITQEELIEWICRLIKENNLHSFYISIYWVRLRKEVLIEDRYECQLCKAKGYYKRANTVHHMNRVRERPDLALSKFYIDENGEKKRQLLSVCFDCHEEEHIKEKQCPKILLTPERW